MKRARFGFAAGCFLGALWLVYTGSLKRNELLAGFCAVVPAAIASEIVRSEEQPRLLLHARMFRPAWRVPGDILRDCILVTRRLLRTRRPAGEFRLIPFRAGGSEAYETARRVLAVEFSTMSPNSIIIGIDGRRNRLLIHELVHAQPPKIVAILGEEKER